MPMNEKAPASNQSIEKMFRIIEAMASVGRPIRLNEIAERSKVSASTAMRILNAMIESGYAAQNQETQLYSLSYIFLWIGNSLRENLSLSEFSKAELNRYLQQHELVPITPKTISHRADLERDLEQVRKNGYAFNDEELMLGMRCVAFPLRISSGEVFAGISISGTIYQINSDNLNVLVSTVQGIIERLYDECRPVLSGLQVSELM